MNTNDELLARIAQLESENEALKHDPAYGILTRPGFEIEMRKVTDATAVIFLDVDKFHDINDSHGYEGANTMMRNALNIRHDDILLMGRRYSGDEIVILVKGDAKRVCERVQESLNKHGLSATISYQTLNAFIEPAVQQAFKRVQDAKRAGQRGVIISE